VKKSELKELIKECIREVVFEEGALRAIVTEVAQGLGTTQLVENKTRTPAEKSRPTDVRQAVREQIARSLGQEERKRPTGSTNPLFEGTKPLDERENSPGVDITNLPGIQNWGNIINRMDKKG